MGAGAPVYSPKANAVETITTSGSSQATTIEAKGGDFATLTVTGGAVFVAIGDTPTAASGSGDLLPDGGSRDFGPLKDGEKIAVIDA